MAPSSSRARSHLAQALVPGPTVAAVLVLLAAVALAVWAGTGIPTPMLLLIPALLTFFAARIDGRLRPAATTAEREAPVPHDVPVRSTTGVAPRNVSGIFWLCAYPDLIWRVPGHASGTVMLGERPERSPEPVSRFGASPEEADQKAGEPQPVELELRGRIVVRGPSAAVHALVRAMLVHLVLCHPPGAWHIVPVDGAPWMRALPHAEVPAPYALALTADASETTSEPTSDAVVVLDARGVSGAQQLATTIRVDADLVGRVEHVDGEHLPFAANGLSIDQAGSVADALRDRFTRAGAPTGVRPW